MKTKNRDVPGLDMSALLALHRAQGLRAVDRAALIRKIGDRTLKSYANLIESSAGANRPEHRPEHTRPTAAKDDLEVILYLAGSVAPSRKRKMKAKK
jgi:hypothetical protein